MTTHITTPCALIVEDSDTHAYIASTLLTRVGFSTKRAPSLTAGIEQANRMLNPAQPMIPTLILLDLMLPHKRCPILEGTACAAWIVEQMEAGTLHPAHIVAISSEMTKQREYEAHVAGCSMTIGKPFTPAHASAARALIDQPPLLPTEQDQLLLDPEPQRSLRWALRREGAELVHFLQSDAAYLPAEDRTPALITAPAWDEEMVRQLIIHPGALLRVEPWRSWIHSQGGLGRVRQRLQEISLSAPRLHAVLNAAITNGEDWQRSANALIISRSTYFRELQQVVAELTPIVQTW